MLMVHIRSVLIVVFYRVMCMIMTMLLVTWISMCVIVMAIPVVMPMLMCHGFMDM